MADLSRQALVAFLLLREGVAERPELASWLFGSYLDALTVSRAELLDTEPSLVVDQAAPGEAAPTIARATQLIQRVLFAFHDDDPDPSVATRLVERRVVEPVVDGCGGSGYAPLGGPGMPLTVRVLALAAAELLTRPERLRADLIVSATSVAIANRPQVSGIGLRRRQTLPWSPAGRDANRDQGWPPRPAPTLAELVAAQDDPDAKHRA